VICSRPRGAVDNDLDTILARGQDDVEIVVDSKGGSR
jgi:hypothetical protein